MHAAAFGRLARNRPTKGTRSRPEGANEKSPGRVPGLFFKRFDAKGREGKRRAAPN